MLLTFSRGFKDVITKTAKFKEFPGLENKFQNSRGFKDTWEPLYIKLHNTTNERRGSIVVSTSAWHAAGRRFDSRTRHVSLLGVKTWLSTEIVYL